MPAPSLRSARMRRRTCRTSSCSSRAGSRCRCIPHRLADAAHAPRRPLGVGLAAQGLSCAYYGCSRLIIGYARWCWRGRGGRGGPRYRKAIAPRPRHSRSRCRSSFLRSSGDWLRRTSRTRPVGGRGADYLVCAHAHASSPTRDLGPLSEGLPGIHRRRLASRVPRPPRAHARETALSTEPSVLALWSSLGPRAGLCAPLLPAGVLVPARPSRLGLVVALLVVFASRPARPRRGAPRGALGPRHRRRHATRGVPRWDRPDMPSPTRAGTVHARWPSSLYGDRIAFRCTRKTVVLDAHRLP
jgi:hypothetical protein